jgi:predicted aspartyl protease
MNSARIPILLLIGLGVILLFALSGGAPRLSGDDLASLVATGIVATMIGSWVLAEMRGNLAESIRNLLVWGVIALALIFAYQNKAMLGFAS